MAKMSGKFVIMMIIRILGLKAGPTLQRYLSVGRIVFFLSRNLITSERAQLTRCYQHQKQERFYYVTMLRRPAIRHRDIIETFLLLLIRLIRCSEGERFLNTADP